MAKVIFYEKPGCGGNARQKALLQRSGHELEVRNLLSAPWTAELLRSFFGSRPVAEWFNTSSPRVKSGEVVPAGLEAEAALVLMLADPLLIRRPLIEVNGRRETGFDAALIDAWIGLATSPSPVGEGCARDTHNQPESCSVPGDASVNANTNQ